MRTPYNSVIQHVIAQSAVAIFVQSQSLCSRKINRRGDRTPANCGASSLPKESTGHFNNCGNVGKRSNVALPSMTAYKIKFELFEHLKF